MTDSRSNPTRARVDRWLWFARFFKTRTLAATAVSRGQVQVNGERVKPARTVKCGDQLRIVRGVEEFTVTVSAIPTRRGPASEAQQSFTEDPASVEQRQQLTAARTTEARLTPRTVGRPDKRTRQLLRARRRDQ